MTENRSMVVTALLIVGLALTVGIGGCPPGGGPPSGDPNGDPNGAPGGDPNGVVTDAPPTIVSCPDGQTLSASANCQATLPDLTTSLDATDAEDATLTVTQDPAAGTLLELGDTTVQFTVTDSAGNDATCTCIVTVADDTAPTLGALGGPYSVTGDQAGSGAVPDFQATVLAAAADNCDDSLAYSQNPAAGTLLAIGVHNVAVSVTDDAGNVGPGTVQLEVLDPNAGEGGFTTAVIVHRGSEQVIAGPEVDASFGTVTPAGYTPTRSKAVAISGDGLKVWFSLYDEFPNVEGDPQTQLWSVNIDGSGGQRSTLPSENLSYGLPLETNIDGSVCYADNGAAKKMYRATPGQAATTAFTYWTEAGGWVYGDIRGEFKITDDATKMIYRSYVNTRIYGVDVSTGVGTPVVVATGAGLEYEGIGSRGFPSNIDLAGDGSRWIFTANYWKNEWGANRDAVWIGSGFDAGATLTMKTVPAPAELAREVSITDDGDTIGYTIEEEYLNAPTPFMVQATDGNTRQEIGDGRTSVTGQLSDNGNRVYYRTSRAYGPGSGNSVLVDVATGRRLPAGTGLFDDAPGVDSGNIRMSDDGQTFVAGSSKGVWTLRDGVDGLTGFPSIDSIAYRFNEDCTMTIRVAVTAPRGVHNIYVTPHIEGEPPTSVVAADVNPTFSFRWGSFDFEELEDETGVWERTVALTNGDDGACAQDLLTSDFVFRVVLLDANETMAIFQDFTVPD